MRNRLLFPVYLSPSVIAEVKRIIAESEVTREDDHNWPPPDRGGRQELEIKSGREHISFTVRMFNFDTLNSKLKSLLASVQK